MKARPSVVLALAFAAGAVAAAGPQSRDRAPVAAGSASISGVVSLAGETRQPARRVRVTLNDVAKRIPGRTTTTDDAGTFAFRGLTPGRYELQGFRNGYLRTSFGASRPDRAGTPIVVKDGDTIEGLVMTIARGGVVTGVVRDGSGRPVPGADVRVLKLGYDAVTGEPRLAAPATSTVGATDDRGEYRAFGLPPGGYLVLVAPRPGRSDVGLEDIQPLTSEDVRRALLAARGGSSAPVTAASTPAATSSPRVSHAPVFHPGSTDIGGAATVQLGVSEERSGIDIVMSLVPTATISGRITSPTGAMPQTLRVMVVPAGPRTEMLAGAGLRTLSASPAPDGTYAIAGVAPGTYTIKALTGTGRGGAGAGDPQSLSAAVEVHVSGQDLDVPLTLQPGVAINGRVSFEGARPTPAELQTLSFRLVAPGSSSGTSVTVVARVDGEGRFALASVAPDTYHVVETWNTPGASDRWTIKASTANGRESFEVPLRVNPNEPVDWTITYTERPTHLAGTFQDRGGRAATDYYILVFSSDRRYWTPGSRRIRMTRPATDGQFSVKGLPAGEYLLGALTDLEAGEWNDPALLDDLSKFGVKLTLVDGQTTTQDVRIGG